MVFREFVTNRNEKIKIKVDKAVYVGILKLENS